MNSSGDTLQIIQQNPSRKSNYSAGTAFAEWNYGRAPRHLLCTVGACRNSLLNIVYLSPGFPDVKLFTWKNF
jgi:hypothetical protein